MVLFYHFGGADSADAESATQQGTALAKLLRQGSFGVDLFFVLSGFLITGILYDTKQELRYFRTFYVRRTLRIFPLYYGVLFVVFILLPLATFGSLRPFAEVSEHQSWLWLYGTNIEQTACDAFLFSSFNHFWSLAVEEHFYLVWPLVIFLCSRRVAIGVSLVCIAGAIALRIGLALAGDYAVAIYTLTLCRMDALSLGALLALTARGPGGAQAVRPWAFGVGGLSALALGAIYVTGKYWIPRVEMLMALRHTFWPLFFVGVLMWSITVPPTSLLGRFWNSRILQFFGKYSYGLYVFHYLLLPLFRQWFPMQPIVDATGSLFVARLVFIAVSTGASVAVALLSWHLFEKHFLKLKDVWAPSRSPKGVVVDAGEPKVAVV
jgi:peptidoglycan/LPS O-acetylase OafA/YrhL